jgi:outer membrane protein OmpA-like peptidoglycan-associated protein
MKCSIVKHIFFGIFLLSCFIGAVGSLHAENSETSKKEQASILKKADLDYDNQNYSLAAVYYEIYLTNDENSNLVLTKLADCYWKLREYDDAFRIYSLLFPNGGEKATRQQRLRIGELYARFGKYEVASQWLKKVNGYEHKADTYNDKLKLDGMRKDSVNWKLGFLDINTPHREFSPFLADSILFFSSNRPLNKKNKASDWDGDNYTRLWKVPVSSLHDQTEDEIKVSQMKIKPQLKNGKLKSLAGVYECADNKPLLSDGKNIKLNVGERNNTAATLVQGLDEQRYNAGAVCMDKKSHFYFSSNYPKSENGVNRIRLMEGIYTASGIKKKHALPFGNPKSYSVMHPAVNQDGTILVFSSDKADGKGGFDLYYSQRSDVNQSWGAFKIFNEKINTLGNEVFPSITPDDVLYFSSDLLPGLGGLDIFRIPLKDAIDGTGEVEHLDYPVNSSGDDFGWAQDSTGTKGYFASDRRNSNDNLYSFFYKVDGVSVSEIASDGKVVDKKTSNGKNLKSYVEGYVLDKLTMKPIKGATVFLLNKQDGKVLIAKTDGTGKYNFVISANNDLTIKAISNGYVNDCYALDATDMLQPDEALKKVPQDLLLSKYIIGKKWKLNNIHYDFNKFNIRPDARPILDSLIDILKTYPITAELGSHTDSRGSFGYNEKLSQKRADAAVAYLVEHGIDKGRITAKGYGETQLLNKCADGVRCSEAVHQANRRTEVKVTGYVLSDVDSELVNPDIYEDGEEINKEELPGNFFETCNKESKQLTELARQTPELTENRTAVEQMSANKSNFKQVDELAIAETTNKDCLAYETMARGGRLALLAKQYYGSRDFWCYIYLANKDMLSSPNNVPVGTVIRIPKLRASLIDKNDAECIRKAKELNDKCLRNE